MPVLASCSPHMPLAGSSARTSRVKPSKRLQNSSGPMTRQFVSSACKRRRARPVVSVETTLVILLLSGCSRSFSAVTLRSQQATGVRHAHSPGTSTLAEIHLASSPAVEGPTALRRKKAAIRSIWDSLRVAGMRKTRETVADLWSSTARLATVHRLQRIRARPRQLVSIRGRAESRIAEKTRHLLHRCGNSL